MARVELVFQLAGNHGSGNAGSSPVQQAAVQTAIRLVVRTPAVAGREGWFESNMDGWTAVEDACWLKLSAAAEREGGCQWMKRIV